MSKRTASPKARQAKRAAQAPPAPAPTANGKAPKRVERSAKITRAVYQTGKLFNGREWNGYVGSFEIVQMADGVCHIFFAPYDWKKKRYVPNGEKYLATARNLKEAMGKANSLLERAERKENERVEAAQSKHDAKHGKNGKPANRKKNGGGK
jgi:hypothetical protein